MLDSRTNLSTEVINEIADHFGDLLTKTRIRSNVKLAEAPSFGKTIFDYEPTCPGADDYRELAAKLMREWDAVGAKSSAESARESKPAAMVEVVTKSPPPRESVAHQSGDLTTTNR